MTFRFLTVASALALAISMPAFADSTTRAKHNAAAEKAANDAAARGDGYQSMRSALAAPDAEAEQHFILVDQRMTARHMLGENIYNEAGEHVARIDDIIVGSNGEARHLILASGGFLGIGEKLSAFDYTMLGYNAAEQRFVMPVTEQMLDRAPDYAFEGRPAGTYSISRMMNRDLLDHAGERVASIDNIALEQGRIKHLIISVDEFLGLGGERAALDFEELSLVVRNGATDFQMNEEQARRFMNYKETVRNDMQ